MMEMYEPCFRRSYHTGPIFQEQYKTWPISNFFFHLPFFLCSSTSNVVRWWISNIRLFDRHTINLQNLDVRLRVPGIRASWETCHDDDIIACNYKWCWWYHPPHGNFHIRPVSPSKQQVRMWEWQRNNATSSREKLLFNDTYHVVVDDKPKFRVHPDHLSS